MFMEPHRHKDQSKPSSREGSHCSVVARRRNRPRLATVMLWWDLAQITHNVTQQPTQTHFVPHGTMRPCVPLWQWGWFDVINGHSWTKSPHFLFRPLGGKYFVYRMMWMNRAKFILTILQSVFFFQEQFQNKLTKMQFVCLVSYRTCLGRASKCNGRNGHQVAHLHHPTFSLPNLHSILSRVESESQQREDQKVGQTDQTIKTLFVKMHKASLNNLIHSSITQVRDIFFFVMFITSFEHSNKLFWIITPEDARSLHKNSIKSMTLNFTALPFYHSTARIRFSSLCRTGEGGEGQKLWDKQHPRNGSSTKAITGSFVQKINK